MLGAYSAPEMLADPGLSGPMHTVAPTSSWQEFAVAGLESLAMPAAELANYLSVHAQPQPLGRHMTVRSVVRVRLPGSPGPSLDFTDLLLAIMHLLVSDHAHYVQVSDSYLCMAEP